MIKILLIGPIPPPYHGCSLANKILVDHFGNSKSHKLTVINTERENISSTQGKFSLKKVISFFNSYLYIHKIAKNDVVYTTPGQTFFGILKYSPFFLTCKILKIPYIIHVHGNHLGNEYSILKGYKRTIFKRLIGWASIGIVLSKSLKSNFDELLRKDKVRVVPNFAESYIYQTPINSKDNKSPKLLYLSNLIEEKGILVFLDALLKLKNTSVNFSAIIAGKIDSRIEQEVYQKLAAIGDMATYIGVVQGKEKLRVLQESNVLVLPTFYTMEGQPLTVWEGMAAENLIVTTRIPGITDYLDESMAFYVEKNSSDDLFLKLKNIIENIESYSEAIPKSNLDFFMNNFTEEAYVRNITDIINEISKP